MNDNESGNMPDHFDRKLGNLHDLPDIVKTKPSTIRVVTNIVGNSEVYIIQTYRQTEEGDTIFLEHVSKQGTVRLAIPPKVADAIARQRDSLGTMVRSKTGKRLAAERKAAGILPGFMKHGARRGGGKRKSKRKPVTGKESLP